MHYFSCFSSERKTKWALPWSDRESSLRSKRFHLFSEQRRGTGFSPPEKWNEMLEGKGVGKKVSFLPFFHSRNFRCALSRSILALFPKTARKRLPRKLQERGKNDVIFFSALCSTPGEDVIPCLRSPEHSKEKRANKQTASPFEKRGYRAGTFPHPLPFSGLFHH